MKLLVFLFMAGICSVHAVEKCDYYKQDCIIGVFMLLSSPLERVPTNQKEMNEYCKLINDMRQCSDELTKSCPTDRPAKSLSESLSAQIKNICESESQQKLILDTASCLHEHVGEIEACLRMGSPRKTESDRKEECDFNAEFMGCVYYESEQACSKNGKTVAELLYKPHNDFTEAYCTSD